MRTMIVTMTDNADNDADDDDNSEPSEATMQQVSFQAFPRAFHTFNARRT